MFVSTLSVSDHCLSFLLAKSTEKNTDLKVHKYTKSLDCCAPIKSIMITSHDWLSHSEAKLSFQSKEFCEMNM